MNNINYRIDKAIIGLKILLQAENEYIKFKYIYS